MIDSAWEMTFEKVLAAYKEKGPPRNGRHKGPHRQCFHDSTDWHCIACRNRYNREWYHAHKTLKTQSP